MSAEFSLQTWNLWCGGSKVNDGHIKMEKLVKAHGAQVICMQECLGDHAREVSNATGRNHAQQDKDCAISTTLDVELIETETAPFGTAAWVHVPAGSRDCRVLIWSVHLAHSDYGPYSALQGKPSELTNSQPEELRRQEQIKQVLEISEELAESDSEIPIVIAGDFNSPASTDWIQRDDKPDHEWLPTDAPIKAGYVDAFRVIYPDAKKVWGDTWSPIEKIDQEPRDRIDFVFVKNAQVSEAVVIGTRVNGEKGATAPEMSGGAPESFVQIGSNSKLRPQQMDNLYPSDHNIVEVRLKL